MSTNDLLENSESRNQQLYGGQVSREEVGGSLVVVYYVF